MKEVRAEGRSNEGETVNLWFQAKESAASGCLTGVCSDPQCCILHPYANNETLLAKKYPQFRDLKNPCQNHNL